MALRYSERKGENYNKNEIFEINSFPVIYFIQE